MINFEIYKIWKSTFLFEQIEEFIWLACNIGSGTTVIMSVSLEEDTFQTF